MAVLAIAAVGSAIGAATITGTVMGMTGAGFGWMVGSMIGSYLFAPEYNSQGPRLTDMKVTGGGYGIPIPITYACPRISGNMIWSSDLIETVTTEEVGKGGGGSEVTTYSYSMNCAIAVCEGPVDCIRRIWANGILIYSAAGGATDTSIISTGGLNIYLGTETQTADPVMQAALGAANVPAHRGLAYVTFEGLQLEKFGNRPPKFDFEIAVGGLNMIGLSEGSYKIFNSTSFASWLGNYDTDFDNTGEFAWWTFSDGATYLSAVIEYDTVPRTYKNIKTTDNGNSWTLGASYSFDSGEDWYFSPEPLAGPATAVKNGDVYIPASDPYTKVSGEKRIIFKTTDGLAFTDAGNWPSPNDAQRHVIRSFRYVASVDKFLISMTPSSGSLRGNLYIYSSSNLTAWTLHATVVNGAEIYHSAQVLYFAGNYYFNRTITDYVSPTFLLGNIEIRKTPDWSSYSTVLTQSPTNLPGDSDPRAIFKSHLETNGDVLVHMWEERCYGANTTTEEQADPKLYVRYSTDGTTWSTAQDLSTGVWLFNVALRYEAGYFIAVNSALPTYNGYTNTHIIWYSRDGISWTTTVLDDNAADYGELGIDRISLMPGDPCGINTEPLSEVITDLVSRVGLTGADIDVTAVGGIGVKGYIIASQMTVRAALESLLSAYNVDAFESNGKIKFVPKESGEIGVTIPAIDLGASENAKTDDDLVKVTRKQELELPNEVVVKYADRDMDYDANQQYARRIVGRSEGAMTVDMPVVLNATEAAQLARNVLFRQWVQRDQYEFSTTQKYSAYEPTDIMFIPHAGENRTIRLVKKEESGAMIKWMGVSEDLSVYTQSVTSDGSLTPAPGMAVRSATELMVFETPVIRDRDDFLQMTVIAGGTTADPWPGGNLYIVGKNGSPTNIGLGPLPPRAVTGILLDYLAPVSDPIDDLLDTTSVLQVQINYGTLESRTEAEIRTGFNLCVVQRIDGTVELLAFQTATLVTTGIYNLTNLLRRIRQNSSYTGASAGDRFALLRAGTSRLIDMNLIDVGTEFEFVGPTYGQAILDATSEFLTLEGVSKKPLSPINVAGVRGSPADLTISWDARSRIGGSFELGENGPMIEASESYEIDIMSQTSPKTVLRTLTATTPSVVYSLSDQVTDFGSPPGSVEVNVYQMSAFIGRGFPANEIV